MLKKFKTKEITLMALTTVFALVIIFPVATALNAVTGIPLAGGLFATTLFVYIIFMAVLIIKKPGAALLMSVLYLTLSVPTTNFGPPGFYKILLGLAIGIPAEIILYIGKYNKISQYLSFPITIFALVPFMWYLLNLMGLPGAEELKQFMLPIMIIYFFLGLIGVFFARLTYNKKLKNTRLVKQI